MVTKYVIKCLGANIMWHVGLCEFPGVIFRLKPRYIVDLSRTTTLVKFVGTLFLCTKIDKSLTTPTIVWPDTMGKESRSHT